ncbi:unnamed protein product [Cyprideis torosa]|uniref:Uncharacterized protein n=1 Tax=Cyprideis torosa TaxID=163714 RepID=A0A7R8ZKR9_9CRUS|nr:unnamed protein product [Cyprideis torosa]CAG0885006.1 unnamed protein product [Cyprideis torosa]
MLLASNSSDEQKEQFYRRAQMLTAMNGTPQSAPPLTIGESRLLNEYQSTPDQKPYGLNHYSNVGPARARGLETPMGLIVSRQSASSSGNSGGLPTTRLPARPPGGDARDFEARMATALRANVFAQRAAQAMSTGQNIYIPSSGSENIYEEISDASLYGYPVARNYWPGLSSSPSSRPSAIPQQTPSARYLSPHHVHHPMTSPQSQSRSLLWGTQTPQEFHRRVLGELNLEVEAMIMPHDPPPPSALDPSTPTSPNDRKTSLSSPGRPKHSKQMSCPEDTVRESRYDVPRIPPAPFSPLLCRQRSLDNSELRRAGSLSQVSATLSELKHLAPRYANGGFLARRRQWIRERGKNGGHVHQLSQGEWKERGKNGGHVHQLSQGEWKERGKNGGHVHQLSQKRGKNGGHVHQLSQGEWKERGKNGGHVHQLSQGEWKERGKNGGHVHQLSQGQIGKVTLNLKGVLNPDLEKHVHQLSQGEWKERGKNGGHVHQLSEGEWKERGKNGGHVHQLSEDSDASSTVTWDASSTTSLLRSHRRRPHAHPHPHSASSTLSGRSSSCEPEYALYDAGYRDPWVSSAGDPGPRKEPPESRNTTNNAADCGTASHPETGKSPQVAQLPTCEDLEQSDPPSPAKQNGGSGTTLADGGTSSDDGADTGFSSCEEPFLYQNGSGGEALNGTAQASSRFTRWFSWRRDGTLIGGE